MHKKSKDVELEQPIESNQSFYRVHRRTHRSWSTPAHRWARGRQGPPQDSPPRRRSSRRGSSRSSRRLSRTFRRMLSPLNPRRRREPGDKETDEEQQERYWRGGGPTRHSAWRGKCPQIPGGSSPGRSRELRTPNWSYRGWRWPEKQRQQQQPWCPKGRIDSWTKHSKGSDARNLTT